MLRFLKFPVLDIIVRIDPDSHRDAKHKVTLKLGRHSDLKGIIELVRITDVPAGFEWRKILHLKVGYEVAFGLWRWRQESGTGQQRRTI